MRLEPGPRENGHRPTIDPLFRTAAVRYGARLTGVLLSGALDDGVTGMGAIKRLGGAVIVQDPEEALSPTMPTSAVEARVADHVVPVAAIPGLLVELATTQVAGKRAKSTP